MTNIPCCTTHATSQEAWRLRRNDIAPLPEPVTLGELVQTLGGDIREVRKPAEAAPVSLWRIRQGATLLHEGCAAQSVFVLRSGSMKRIRTLEDGYEQVLSFAQPGELLGFDALHSGRQPAAVVALEDSTVCVLPLNDHLLARHDCLALDRALQVALSRQLVRTAGTTEMMAALASDVRLARFLLWMSQRMDEAGRSPRRLFLRMCRRDIASLLGVAHETVSRSFTLLAELGLVKVENREVEILDLDGLHRRALNTRRAGDEAPGAAQKAASDWSAALQPDWFAPVRQVAAAAA